MASNEATFRTELMEAARKFQRGYAAALPSVFQAGLPDIVVQCKGFPAVFMELKFLERVGGESFPINLTPTQRRTIRNIREGGGYAAWVLCVKRRISPGPRWIMLSSRDWIVETASIERHLVQTRLPGEPWDIERLLQRIVSSSSAESSTASPTPGTPERSTISGVPTS